MTNTNAANVFTGGEVGARFTAAARGDLEAQRMLRQDRIDHMAQGGGYATLFGLEALFLSRLCAGHGEASDARVLAGLLCENSSTFRNAGHQSLGDLMMTECLGILESLTADGDDLAAVCSNALIASQPAYVIDSVRALTDARHD